MLRCEKRPVSLEPRMCEGEWPEVDTAIWTGATSHHAEPAQLAGYSQKVRMSGLTFT